MYFVVLWIWPDFSHNRASWTTRGKVHLTDSFSSFTSHMFTSTRKPLPSVYLLTVAVHKTKWSVKFGIRCQMSVRLTTAPQHGGVRGVVEVNVHTFAVCVYGRNAFHSNLIQEVLCIFLYTVVQWYCPVARQRMSMFPQCAVQSVNSRCQREFLSSFLSFRSFFCLTSFLLFFPLFCLCFYSPTLLTPTIC